MNWFKRLFKREIEEIELDNLLLALGKSKEFISDLYAHKREEYTSRAYGKLDIKEVSPKRLTFDLIC